MNLCIKPRSLRLQPEYLRRTLGAGDHRNGVHWISVPNCDTALYPTDAAWLDVCDGSEVVVSSRRGRIQFGVHLTDEVLPGQVFWRSTSRMGSERAHLWLDR
jgi:predicted molibdopterin-dependent oxidoreductase YjgC